MGQVVSLGAGLDEGDFLSQADIWRTLPYENWLSLPISIFRNLIWRRLPATQRRGLATRILNALAPLPSGSQGALPITIVGFLESSTGLGEAARLNAEAMSKLGYDVRAIDISGLQNPDLFFKPHRKAEALEKGPGTLLLHFNPETLSVALPLIGRARVAGKRVVGYWAWELPRIPPSWVNALRFVDEIWTPSHFTASSIIPFTSKPVRVVPHPVAIRERGTSRRPDFGIFDDVFTVLCMFNFSSLPERKNPIGAIEAFRMAFGNDPKAQLILKSSNAGQFPEAFARVRAAASGATNIRLLESDLDRTMIRDLIASVDVVLSLHRAEGFGLVMAEAMHSGVPVIATDWSGNLDFMDSQSGALIPAKMVPSSDPAGFYSLEGQVWADPDLSVAADWLRRLAASLDLRRWMGERGRQHVSDRLGLINFGRTVSEAIQV